jgi:hypothetical protein
MFPYRASATLVVLSYLFAQPLVAQPQPDSVPPAIASAPKVAAPQPGMSVFSSDNTKVGTVETVDGTPDGRITAVNVTTGGFLGFGVKVVPIPEGKFALVGQIIRVEMTEDEIRRLPHESRRLMEVR